MAEHKTSLTRLIAASRQCSMKPRHLCRSALMGLLIALALCSGCKKKTPAAPPEPKPPIADGKKSEESVTREEAAPSEKTAEPVVAESPVTKGQAESAADASTADAEHSASSDGARSSTGGDGKTGAAATSDGGQTGAGSNAVGGGNGGGRATATNAGVPVSPSPLGASRTAGPRVDSIAPPKPKKPRVDADTALRQGRTALTAAGKPGKRPPAKVYEQLADAWQALQPHVKANAGCRALSEQLLVELEKHGEAVNRESGGTSILGKPSTVE